MEDGKEKKIAIAVTHKTMTEQVYVSGVKKANHVSLAEQTILSGTESFRKKYREKHVM